MNNQQIPIGKSLADYLDKRTLDAIKFQEKQSKARLMETLAIGIKRGYVKMKE
jgi:hypothetical protein